MVNVVNAPIIISSPWAMLITPIVPNVIANPNDIKMRIDPRDSPSLRHSKAVTYLWYRSISAIE